MLELIKEHWEPLLIAVLGLAEVIIRITPSEKDNTLFAVLKRGLDFLLANKKKGGGTHK